MKPKPYVGRTEDGEYAVFPSAETPTLDSHSRLYSVVIRPFGSLRGAHFMAQFGSGNPHCRTVEDAERLARSHKMRRYTFNIFVAPPIYEIKAAVAQTQHTKLVAYGTSREEAAKRAGIR